MLAAIGGHRDLNRCISARSDDTVLQSIVRRMLRHLTLDVKFDFAHVGKQGAAVAFIHREYILKDSSLLSLPNPVV